MSNVVKLASVFDKEDAEARKDAPTKLDRLAGNLLRARRVAAGLGQEKVAAGVGISYPQIQKYEYGTNRISVGRLIELGNAIGFNPADFITELAKLSLNPAVVEKAERLHMDTARIHDAVGKISNSRDRKALLALANHFARKK